MPTITGILHEFKKQLIAFLDELIELFPSESDFVLLRIFIENQADIASVMNDFLSKLEIHDLRDLIRVRNEKFFLKYSIFKQQEERENNLRRLWLSGKLDDEDKQTMWLWADSFVILATRYSKVLQLSSQQKNNI